MAQTTASPVDCICQSQGSASQWTQLGISFSIASLQNSKTTHALLVSIKHVLAFITVWFVMYSTSTKAQHWTWKRKTMNSQQMLWDADLCQCPSEICSKTKWMKFCLRCTRCKHGRSIFVTSLLKMFQSKANKNYVWGLHFFQVIYILDVLKIKKLKKTNQT